MMLGLDFEHGGRRQVTQRDSAFDFRLDNVAVYFVTEIGMRREHKQPSHPAKGTVRKIISEEGPLSKVTSVRATGHTAGVCQADVAGLREQSESGEKAARPYGSGSACESHFAGAIGRSNWPRRRTRCSNSLQSIEWCPRPAPESRPASLRTLQCPGP